MIRGLWCVGPKRFGCFTSVFRIVLSMITRRGQYWVQYHVSQNTLSLMSYIKEKEAKGVIL